MDLKDWELENKILSHESLSIRDNVKVLDIVEYEGSLYTVIENGFSEIILKPLAKFRLKQRKRYGE
jgi:hypothetical protein